MHTKETVCAADRGFAPSGEFFKGGEKNDSKQEVGEGGIIENNIYPFSYI